MSGELLELCSCKWKFQESTWSVSKHC